MDRSAKTLNKAFSVLPELTGIRAIAAGLVFFHHAEKWIPGAAGVKEGQAGVAVFFGLSGFLIARAYGPRLAAGLSFREYLARRLARIYPAYFALLIVTLALTGAARTQSAAHWLSQLTLTQGYFVSLIWSGLDPIAWSLSAELSFYLLAPLILLSRRPLAALAAAVAAFALTGFALAEATIPPFSHGPYLVWNFTIFGRLPEFAVGMAAGMLSPGFRGSSAGNFLLGVSCVAAIAGIAMLDGISAASSDIRLTSAAPLWVLAQLFFAAATAALSLAVESGCGPARLALGNPLMVYLGRVSYPLYLLNAEPLFRGLHAAFAAVVPAAAGSSLAFLLVLFGASALIHHLLEAPAHAWLTSRIPRNRLRPYLST